VNVVARSIRRVVEGVVLDETFRSLRRDFRVGIFELGKIREKCRFV
jgi:hypothetical protein